MEEIVVRAIVSQIDLKVIVPILARIHPLFAQTVVLVFPMKVVIIAILDLAMISGQITDKNKILLTPVLPAI